MTGEKGPESEQQIVSHLSSLACTHFRRTGAKLASNMNSAHGAPGASRQKLGASAAFTHLSLSALRREVLKILAQKRRAIASFDGSRQQDIVKVRFHSSILLNSLALR